jgi:hypothetical protein
MDCSKPWVRINNLYALSFFDLFAKTINLILKQVIWENQAGLGLIIKVLGII